MAPKASQPTAARRTPTRRRAFAAGRNDVAIRHRSQSDIARHLGVSPVAVAKWKQRLAAGTLTALSATTARGATARLTTEQWQQLKTIILAGAQAAGFPTERWTLPRIQQVILKQWNIRYSTAWISIRLRELGLSVQRPQVTATPPGHCTQKGGCSGRSMASAGLAGNKKNRHNEAPTSCSPMNSA